MDIWDFFGQMGKVVKFMESGKRSAAKRPLPGHTLYHFYLSPFSKKARYAVYEHGFDIPFKDVLTDPVAWQELVKQGGKDQSPCLRIDGPQGSKWMYESEDIVSYLKSKA
jgi:glutathione S-transferase